MNEDCESCMEHAVDGASPCAIHGTVRPARKPCEAFWTATGGKSPKAKPKRWLCLLKRGHTDSHIDKFGQKWSNKTPHWPSGPRG